MLVHCVGIAKDIVRIGGKKIQKESDKYVKNNGKLSPGDIAMTTPGDLDCKYLLHTVGPVYSKYFPPKTKKEGDRNLAKCITNILDKAD